MNGRSPAGTDPASEGGLRGGAVGTCYRRGDRRHPPARASVGHSRPLRLPAGRHGRPGGRYGRATDVAPDGPPQPQSPNAAVSPSLVIIFAAPTGDLVGDRRVAARLRGCREAPKGEVRGLDEPEENRRPRRTARPPETPDTRHQTPDTRHRKTRHQTPDTRDQRPDTRPDTRPRHQTPETQTPDTQTPETRGVGGPNEGRRDTSEGHTKADST